MLWMQRQGARGIEADGALQVQRPAQRCSLPDTRTGCGFHGQETPPRRSHGGSGCVDRLFTCWTPTEPSPAPARRREDAASPRDHAIVSPSTSPTSSAPRAVAPPPSRPWREPGPAARWGGVGLVLRPWHGRLGPSDLQALARRRSPVGSGSRLPTAARGRPRGAALVPRPVRRWQCDRGSSAASERRDHRVDQLHRRARRATPDRRRQPHRTAPPRVRASALPPRRDDGCRVSDPEVPSPQARAEAFARCWQSKANGLALLFGGPLYLVGSILTETIRPATVDIRCCIEQARTPSRCSAATSWESEWTPARFLLHRRGVEAVPTVDTPCPPASADLLPVLDQPVQRVRRPAHLRRRSSSAPSHGHRAAGLLPRRTYRPMTWLAHEDVLRGLLDRGPRHAHAAKPRHPPGFAPGDVELHHVLLAVLPGSTATIRVRAWGRPALSRRSARTPLPRDHERRARRRSVQSAHRCASLCRRGARGTQAGGAALVVARDQKSPRDAFCTCGTRAHACR